MKFILQFLVTAAVIYVLMQYGYLSDSITLDKGPATLIVFTAILGIVNMVLGGILRLITLPIRFLTLGLFSFVISIFVVYMTDQFVAGISLTGWTPVVVIALVMGVIGSIFG